MALMHSTFLWLHLILTIVTAHTWIEQVSVLADNGTLIGAPGFARNNVFRVAGADVDQKMTYKLPVPPSSTIASTDSICQASQQEPNTTFALQALSNSRILLRYQENGHITKPYNQQGKLTPGNVSVYGTGDSLANDTLLAIHQVWNSLGTGGDQRGVLLTTTPFDNQVCYENNDSPISQQRQINTPPPDDPLQNPNLWCGTVVTLPSLPANSIYSLYWVWDWPGVDPHGQWQEELYTTCLDVIIAEG